MKRALITTFVLMVAPSAWAIDCQSVSGHLGGVSSKATRQAVLHGNTLTLNGTFGSMKSPQRKLPCIALAKGVLCETTFGPATVSITTNGNRMIESVVATATGKEQAGFAYVCDGALKL